MTTTKAQQKAVAKYVKSKYDRFGLTMPKGKLDTIKAHAETHGESANAFINRAIDETMQHDDGQGLTTCNANAQKRPEYAAGIDESRILLVELTPQIKESVEQAAKESDMTIAEYVGNVLSEKDMRELEAHGLAVVPVTMSNAAFKRILAAANAAGAKVSDYMAIAAPDRSDAQSAPKKPTRRRNTPVEKDTEPQQMELTEAAKPLIGKEAIQAMTEAAKLEAKPAPPVDPLEAAVKRAGAARQEKRRAEMAAAEAEIIAAMPKPDNDETESLKKRFAEAVKSSSPKAPNPDDDIIAAD